ncbi:MAG: DUF2207 domain-containing protein [Chloroflexi bacterium]|nr:DUF2207 domain-containing protein [Chloroflexota bacterium]MDA1239601.1 DUF2207 domain-containing protein [Chloroflexota bacterium]
MTSRRQLASLAVAVFAILAAGLGVGGRAAAQTSERILSYDVTIEVERGGMLLIEERIHYDFGSNERRGIFRDIPIRLRYDDTYDRLYSVNDVAVASSTGAPSDLALLHEPGGILRIRIGDPDVTISGRHQYEVRYRVSDALNAFESHDELYWNAIGTTWDVPIDRATISVRVPAEVGQIACFAGYEGSNLACEHAARAGSNAAFGDGGLVPYQGVTVVVAIPKGAVTAPVPVLEERWTLARAFEVTPLTLGGAGATMALVLGGVSRVIWLRGRDRRFRGSPVDVVFGGAGGEDERVPLFQGGPYPVEYSPPDRLRPGQIGLIIDEVAHTVDVTATIVDLAVRGYLHIEEIPGEGWWRRKPDWQLSRRRAPDASLLEYERLLMESLFAGREEVKLSTLRTKFHTQLSRVQDAMYKDALEHGWYHQSPEKTRGIWVAIGIVALIAAIALQAAAIAFTRVALIPIPLVLGALILLIAHPWMPRRTARGTAALTRVRGFQRFIASAETERARFAEQAQLFYEYLPYAIVFGVTERWARAFEGLAQMPDQTWYRGSQPLAFGTFATAMDDFSVTTGGTIASTPGGSGSSGFSGGSSGGGGGGGGGGSW